MELEEIKKIWKQMDGVHQSKAYSPEEIDSFRKARSKDFTGWVRTSLNFDIVVKSIIGLACLVLLVLYLGQPLVAIICAILFAVILITIPIERKAIRKAHTLDVEDGSVQEILKKKVAYLKTMYFRIQMIQGLSNPLLVIAGALIYYKTTYNQVPVLDLVDWVVLISIVLISFFVTLPTTFGLYGYHLKTLQGCLGSFTDPDGWAREMKVFKKQRKVLSLLLGFLLVLGIILLFVVVII